MLGSYYPGQSYPGQSGGVLPVTVESDRPAKTTGTDFANSERSSVLTGQDFANSERSATLLGTVLLNDTRAGSMAGGDGWYRERFDDTTFRDAGNTTGDWPGDGEAGMV